jgi:hypothetical protein
MKKIIKTIVVTLSILVILNFESKVINAKDINNQSENTITIESQAQSTNNDIDPESKGK